MILSKSGYATKVAYSGEQALELASVFEPHLLITDVVMSGITGIEVANQNCRTFAVLQSDHVFRTSTSVDSLNSENCGALRDPRKARGPAASSGPNNPPNLIACGRG